MMAILRLDGEQRFIICPTPSSAEGEPYQRMRWSKSQQRAPRVSLEVPQPKAAEMYSSCDLRDQRNRCRQDDLQLEEKCVTTIWLTLLNVTLIGIIIADSIFLALELIALLPPCRAISTRS
jgi:hypothetical protein